jgi:hypothetical protein
MKQPHEFSWTGTHVSGSTACAVVRYHGPTDTKGSRWIATITRGIDVVWRGTVCFTDGPIEAALAACKRGGVDWAPTSCNSIDSDSYVVGF